MISLPIAGKNQTYTVNPTKIIALGLNYRAHIAESKSVNVKGFTDEVPEEPILFTKTPNCLIGPNETIVIPKFLEQYGFKDMRNDYEAELALVIKDRCKNVFTTEAMDHILGFTCFNDVSQRNLQRRDKSGWFRAKSLDTYGPIGPQVVLTEDLSDPQNLAIHCRLNGKTVQSSNTQYMIFSIPEIIAFITSNITLMPGDIVVTGTPGGVGPLKHGDVVEVEIENIGVLRNPVIDEVRS